MYNQNLFRVIEVLELAKKFNRKVFIYDDALCDVLHYMQTLGYYDFSNLKMINQEEFNNDMGMYWLLWQAVAQQYLKKYIELPFTKTQLLP